MIFLACRYLINAKAVPEGVKLILFNASTDDWETLDIIYRPHFYVPHPMSRSDIETVKALLAETTVEEKRDLFSGQVKKFTRVEIEGSSEPLQASKKFERAWEGEVPYILGYAYEKGLIFGAQHIFKGKHLMPNLEVSEEMLQRFQERFKETREVDPTKYELIERWFTLCSQPIPEVSLESLGVSKKQDEERYYLAFILSRLANLPVPTAYSNRQVSTWIKSILHNHLRRNNILIPTSRELRRGEKKKSITGALTFPPKPGLYFNTVVVDFESLYPSLIDAYNLSYETINCFHKECYEQKVPGTNHHICHLRRGVYSILMGSLKDLRIRWFKPLAKENDISPEERRLAQATSRLLKLILVSSYGVTVRIHGLAHPSLAESITAYGRYSLQTTWNMAKDGGLHPIYGDTDSLFLDDPRDDQLEWLIQMVKERLQLDLAIDVQYSICVLPRVMKAYFGIRRNGTPDIKGVTAIKSNSPAFIQDVFRDCVKVISEVKNQTQYIAAKERIQRLVKNAITDLKAGKIPLKNLEVSVRLHEDPLVKTGEVAIHQPYQCALQLIDSGKNVQKGDVVNYVKVRPFNYKGRNYTVKPKEHLIGLKELDFESYTHNLRTSLNQAFKPMGILLRKEDDGKVALSDFI